MGHWILRTGSFLHFLPWVGVMLAWWIGGWGLLAKGFRWTDKKAQVMVGWGVGLIIYLWLVNVLGRWLPAELGFSLPSLLILGAGLIVAGSPKRALREFLLGFAKGWQGWLIFGAVAVIMLEVEFGLLVFDEHRNLPLISTLAAGYIPPRNFFDPIWPLAYHYAFHLLGASLVRLGDMFPWTAFDLSKALIFSYSLLLAWLLSKEYLQHRTFQWLFVGGYVFTGGTRYLLLLLPPPLIARLNKVAPLWGSTASVADNLSDALTGLWRIDGAPPLTWPIAFLNGIKPALVMAHGTFLPLLLLVWLLSRRIEGKQSIGVLTLLLSGWALAEETTYGLVVIGTGLWAGWLMVRRALFARMRWWSLAVLLSLGVSAIQGGTITQALIQILATLGILHVPIPPVSAGSGGLSFELRWPPAVVSAHLGELSLFQPLAWPVAILEMGIGVLLTPWILQWARRRVQQYKNHEVALVIFLLGGAVGFLFSIFVRYAIDRDIIRMSRLGIGLLLLLLSLALEDWYRAQRWTLVYGGVASVILMMVPGIVLGALQLSAIQHPDFAEGISRYDAEVARKVWDQLPRDALVFDPNGGRAVTLTGRFTRFGVWVDQEYPEHRALVEKPSVEKFLHQGFTYIYVPHEWWYALSPQEQADLEQPCVQVVAESVGPEDPAYHAPRFRRLLDLSACVTSVGP